jgi:hypothetical protein
MYVCSLCSAISPCMLQPYVETLYGKKVVWLVVNFLCELGLIWKSWTLHLLSLCFAASLPAVLAAFVTHYALHFFGLLLFMYAQKAYRVIINAAVI